MAEQGHGKKTKRNGPGIVQGLRLLSRQKIIRLQQYKIISKRINCPEKHPARPVPGACLNKQCRLLLQNQNNSQNNDRKDGWKKEEFNRRNIPETYFKSTGDGRPEQHCGQGKKICFSLIFHKNF